MKKEVRTVCFDEELGVEAYRFEGVMQPFPNHFHEYYVIGLIEAGERGLSCRNQEYFLQAGDMVLFQPGDNHSCAQRGQDPLEYRGLNLPRQVMLELTAEVTGRRELPGFSRNVIRDEELNCYFRSLHHLLMEGSQEFEKEETLLLLLSLLLERYAQPFERCVPECREEVEAVCAFLRMHFAEKISLEQICKEAGLSKSTLLRVFTKTKGITPYRYLETLRVNEAKKLLEQGATPMEAAMETGFSDQSHFTNFFSAFIGLTPGAYRGVFLEKEQKKKEKEGEKHGLEQ